MAFSVNLVYPTFNGTKLTNKTLDFHIGVCTSKMSATLTLFTEYGFGYPPILEREFRPVRNAAWISAQINLNWYLKECKIFKFEKLDIRVNFFFFVFLKIRILRLYLKTLLPI